jgi:hypothetical protein
MAALVGDTLIVVLETVTAALTEALVPPAPLQVSMNDELAAMGPEL